MKFSVQQNSSCHFLHTSSFTDQKGNTQKQSKAKHKNLGGTKKKRTMENWMWGDRRSRKGLEHVKPAKKQLK